MKLITPFLLLLSLALSACNTPVDRRNLYSPPKPSGPYTEALQTGSWKRGEYPIPKQERKGDAAPNPPLNTEPPPAR